METNDAATPQNQQPPTYQATFLTPQELADYLKVSLDTVRTWRKNGTAPPAYKVGKHLRFDLDQVHLWLEASLERAGS